MYTQKTIDLIRESANRHVRWAINNFYATSDGKLRPGNLLLGLLDFNDCLNLINSWGIEAPLTGLGGMECWKIFADFCENQGGN